MHIADAEVEHAFVGQKHSYETDDDHAHKPDADQRQEGRTVVRHQSLLIAPPVSSHHALRASRPLRPQAQDLPTGRQVRIVTAASLFDGHDAAINIPEYRDEAHAPDHTGHGCRGDHLVTSAVDCMCAYVVLETEHQLIAAVKKDLAGIEIADAGVIAAIP